MTPDRTIALPTMRAGLVLAAAVALAACAGVPPPKEQMAVATAAINHAAAADAGALAPAEMGMARDKMARAQQALLAKDHERAAVLAQQAQLDAQVAEAKAEAVKSRKAAEAVKEAGSALRDEMGRQAPANTTTPKN